ncbi:hypothetical protein HXX76_009682 [Chlamydomonas incerta]|uniref:Uncharacterized protein n=1 Tax=Chlamydomonas incerta TaxID=51695 RepID=A0A835SPX5_CHLIN|nr:hypothetical protein HXX76_009682 [Chlamydomonas incerta]|eukprot:KAG2431152.1 hypothetical protein HXX76_009682 [Chlamydomonas incerta]
MVSELRPLTQLTKLEVFNPTGVASATDCACLPALRNLDLDSGLLDARGLEALTRLTSLAVGLLLGPEHIAALSGDADGWAFGEELLATDAGLPVVLPPLELPLPVYRLPPQLVQLRFYAAAQFVEVLGALQVPPSLKRVMALDGNEAIDHLQLPLLQGRHTTAVVEGGAPDQGPRLLPAAAQAMQRFAQQLGSRWHGCRDVRPIYVAPPTPEWQPVQGAPVLLPPPPGWNLPPGPRGRGLQQAPGSHGAWVSALAAMPGLRGLWLQGLALTSADLRAIGTAFTSIRTLSLVGLNPRCCPYPALLALGPLLPRLHKLRVAGDALLISPDDEDAEEQVRAAAMRGAVAATLASLCHFGGATLPDTNSNSTNTSSNSTNTNTHSGSSGSLGFSGTVQLVCACGRAQDHVLDGVAALHLRDGVIEALQELEVLAPAAMGEELAAGLEVDVEHVDRAARACDDSGPAQPLGHEWAD